MDLDVRQLRAFVAVAEHCSFTRSAAQLNLSQPALTVQIRTLERVLGLRLFDRNTRSVALTRSGHELLPVLTRILRDIDTVLSDARQLSTLRRGIVRLAVLPSFASGVLPEIIADFRKAHPGIGFVIRDVIASGVAALTLAEEVDLGITGGAVSHPDVEALLYTHDHMHVVFPDGHALGERDTILLDDIARYPLILMDAATSVRQIVDAAFAASGLHPDISAEATYMSTAVGMVRAGLGVAILPGSAMEVGAVPSLRSRPIAAAGLTRQIAVIKRRNRTLPPAGELFLGELARRLPPSLGLGG
jgi:DNA-binding transcriptional LysR family regulator